MYRPFLFYWAPPYSCLLMELQSSSERPLLYELPQFLTFADTPTRRITDKPSLFVMPRACLFDSDAIRCSGREIRTCQHAQGAFRIIGLQIRGRIQEDGLGIPFTAAAVPTLSLPVPRSIECLSRLLLRD